ncbi:hypothetical protein BC940DRAFT_324037 [Gongronella butleri]|nr:hypothetical protein BC940DRAFT_324037 [Gongronella butleri]
MQSPTYTSPSLDLPTNTDKNVQGWLMGVPGYRDTTTLPQEPLVLPVDHALPAAPKRQERRKSTSSTASDDSVNLDDLINKNNILSVDDETDLPNLSTLDLDDNKEDFWQLDHAAS